MVDRVKPWLGLKNCVSSWGFIYEFLSHLPSELSSKHGGSLPLYFCSKTCLSPVSKPGREREMRLKCYPNIPEAGLNSKFLQIGSSIYPLEHRIKVGTKMHWIQEKVLQWIRWKALVFSLSAVEINSDYCHDYICGNCKSIKKLSPWVYNGIMFTWNDHNVGLVADPLVSVELSDDEDPGLDPALSRQRHHDLSFTRVSQSLQSFQFCLPREFQSCCEFSLSKCLRQVLGAVTPTSNSARNVKMELKLVKDGHTKVENGG